MHQFILPVHLRSDAIRYWSDDLRPRPIFVRPVLRHLLSLAELMREGQILVGVGAVFAVWAVVVIADAVLSRPFGPDDINAATTAALLFFSVGLLLSWLGLRMWKQ